MKGTRPPTIAPERSSAGGKAKKRPKWHVFCHFERGDFNFGAKSELQAKLQSAAYEKTFFDK